MADEGHTQQPNNETTQTPIGAVMVVGGGIGGIQAALDVAEGGFKVYLVESKSAIGGHMAQLDKTFPTNDCAMCTLAPRLVEAGRHLNIEILTDTEVLAVKGAAGNFTATLRRKPRYIDVTKCIGCGDCEKVCPIAPPDPYNENLSSRRAAYRLYPQAIPAAYAIEKRGIAPCRDGCPAGQRAQGYIALIAEGRYREALRVIKEDNPFPSVCGRSCHHPCEGRCSRALVDDAVSIMGLKRFVVDYALAYGREPVQRVPRTRPGWIAIVGAGPAGLTAARDLVMKGYGVTVFEALPFAGGMMRVGIPAHRLPKGVLQQDIDDILALGVILKTNSPVRDPTTLLQQGYHAVCLATGITARNPRLGIEGEDAQGVISAATFLRKINLGEPAEIGNRVIIVGGGITAMDAAAVARRLGAAAVTIAFNRSRTEIPAYQWEIEEVEREGIRLLEKTVATRILTQNGKAVGVELARTAPGEFVDESGRRRPKTEPGSESTLQADTVIRVIGQASDLSHHDPRYDDLAGDSETLASEIPGLFVVGGKRGGATFIIEAIALGHKVAAAIDRYLRGEPLKQLTPKPPVFKFTREELAQRVLAGDIKLQVREQPAMLPLDERVMSFREVVLGLTAHQARAEARRCLQCGICSECLECVYACGVNAIDHNMVAREEQIRVGAVILAPGYEVYQAELSEEFGFGRFRNVVTSLQFERLLSASGPTGGHVSRPSDGKPAKKIAFLQCIGSRDQTHDYCSAVCCMYAAKEAMMAKEHVPDTEVRIFMMDVRAFSKGYAEYYRRAQERYGVKYTRCRVSALKEDPSNGNLIVRHMEVGDSVQPPTSNLQPPTSNRIIEEEFDLVVLSVGMEMSQQVRDLGTKLGIQLDDYGFCRTIPFHPLETSRPGIFAAGPFIEPKDIPETVMDASGAAANAEALLAQVRGALARQKEYPPERDVVSKPPRVGVFVCHCGSNIAGYLDVKEVAEYARTLPNVVHTETNLYTCAQDSIARITQVVKEHNLNRVVVAACTPRTHEPLFQDSIRAAGLNAYLFEMANIRNQCSWVHSHDWDVATAKAKDLVRASVARVSRLEPLHKVGVPLVKSALVIGGGVAGMTAALALASQGFPVHLVERSARLGGGLGKSTVNSQQSTVAADSGAYLQDLIARVNTHPLIHVHRETRLVETSGFVGNFASRLRRASGEEQTIRHGAIIVATGAQEWRGDAYGLGREARVVTQSEFGELISQLVNQSTRQSGSAHSQLIDRLTDYQLTNVVMILCVGPAEQYCGRVCCMTALENALRLKELNPDAQVTILYRDIRTYGFRERLYRDVRAAGVMFIRYDDAHLPQVNEPMSQGNEPMSQLANEPNEQAASSKQQLAVRVWEPILQEEITLKADLVVLATPPVPSDGARELANILKVPVDQDGWFLEAHVKLRPVDFATEGVFMAGAAHYPKFLNEAIAQAQAAAARAATILSKDALLAGGIVAQVDAAKCTACLTCVRICPYRVPRIVPTQIAVGGIYGAAHIEAAACQGCGICAAECPAKAIELLHFKDAQVVAKVEALFAERELVAV